MKYTVSIPKWGSVVVNSEQEAIETVAAMNLKRNVVAGDPMASTYKERHERKLSDTELAALDAE